MRIIAGTLHGRRLNTLQEDIIRPTSGRLRESLFNILLHAPWSAPMAGCHVLDAFAGTGALGLEALSRGAATATFMENDPRVRALLEANIAACRVERTARIVGADALRPPPVSGPPANLVFLDPPYGKGLVVRACDALQAAGWIARGALIVVETSHKEPLEPLGELLSDRLVGLARASIWRLA